MVPLASRIAEQFGSRDELDAAAPGRAAEALHRDPARWSDWAGPHETWQHIKQLWHVLVRFGRRRLGSNNGGDAATPRSA